MYVQIEAETLKQLVSDAAFYQALLASGVDNWQGYDSTEWPTYDSVNMLYNDFAREVWHNTPPEKPVAKALLRWVKEDSEYYYMTCSWGYSSHNEMTLYDVEYMAPVAFDTGDQWMELEHEVANELTT